MREALQGLVQTLLWTELLNDGDNRFYCLRCTQERPNHSATCPVAKALMLGREALKELT